MQRAGALDPGNPFQVVGGTSLSAPAWAGLLAVVDQGRAAAGEPALNSTGPTEVQQALYSLPQSDYNTITSGGNGYSAGAGYNLVTGLGTPVANLLVPDLVAYQGPGTSYSGPTVGPLQNATLSAGWSGGGGADDVFSVFDSIVVRSSAPGRAPSREMPVSDANRAVALIASPSKSAAISAVDQVLGMVVGANSDDTLIGDLAFEQISSGTHKARGRTTIGTTI